MTALKEKGLPRSGATVRDRGGKARPGEVEGDPRLVADYLAIAERKNEADLGARESAQLEERRVELQEKSERAEPADQRTSTSRATTVRAASARGHISPSWSRNAT